MEGFNLAYFSRQVHTEGCLQGELEQAQADLKLSSGAQTQWTGPGK